MVDYVHYAVIPQDYNCADLSLYISMNTHNHIDHSRVKDLTHPSLAAFVDCPLNRFYLHLIYQIYIS